MNPFRNILKLSVGDFIAKAAYFLAFVYMAQKLGVAGYGVLEFAIAVRTYLLLLADAGLELWAVREAAKGVDVRLLAARVIPVRLTLAVVAIAATGIFAALPGNPNLRRILPLLTLTVLVQAFNLKWAFMGQERMARVAVGLVASQAAFALTALLLIRRPEDLILVPIIFLVAEIVLTGYFWRQFVRLHGAPRLTPDWSGIRGIAKPVLTLGAGQCLGLVNFNVDSILIGLMLGPGPVGWYAAAYKPVTAILAVAVTYYQGLFPALARHHKEDRAQFREILDRSLRFSAIVALPVGVGGTLLAAPIIQLLFGPSYAASVPALQLLAWSAVLVIMRGNFRHSLTAAGHQRLDLTCAGIAAILNVALNLILIPRYQIAGAATATVISEIVWFTLARYFFSQNVTRLAILPLVWRPVMAAIAMGVCLTLMASLPWMVSAALSLVVYLVVLFVLGEPVIRPNMLFPRPSAQSTMTRVRVIGE